MQHEQFPGPLTEYFAKTNGQVERKIEQSENGEEVEDQLCDVCNSAEPVSFKIGFSVTKLRIQTEGNEVIFCDGCNVAVHLGEFDKLQMFKFFNFPECYGVADNFVVPKGDWFCSVCTTLDHGALPPCVLCPNVGGAMKSTKVELVQLWINLIFRTAKSGHIYRVYRSSRKQHGLMTAMESLSK